MGQNVSKVVHYYCMQDCQQGGCPGHTIQLKYSRSVDILAIVVDGKTEFLVDDNEWQAIKDAEKTLP
jgi:hypothetical protein